MNAREQLLVALEGGEPDRVPCALGFYHVDIDDLASRGGSRSPKNRLDWRDAIDVHFVKFPISQKKRL